MLFLMRFSFNELTMAGHYWGLTKVNLHPISGHNEGYMLKYQIIIEKKIDQLSIKYGSPVTIAEWNNQKL